MELDGGGSGRIMQRVAGAVYLFPGRGQMLLQGRESFSSSSVEFINSIGQSSPYLIGGLDSRNLQKVKASLAGVVMHVIGKENARGLSERVLELRKRGLIPPFSAMYTELGEKSKLGNDMFVYLAMANLKVFLVGGTLVALAGLITIALVNFKSGKRTYALLRLRGASPSQIVRTVLTEFIAPLSMGALIGIPVGLITGYGLTNVIFSLPWAGSILRVLSTHLILSWVLMGIIGGVFAAFFVSAFWLSSWVFRKTAREAVNG